MKRIPVLVILFVACGGSGAVTTLPVGQWGGRNLELTVADSGASATFFCGATGTIAQAIALDGSGNFDVPGVYTPLLVRTGPQPARYGGTVHGSTMTLAVSLDGTVVGPFELAAGAPGTFEPCNF